MLTDSDHLKMPRLHFLLQHWSVGEDTLKVLDIVSSSDGLTTEMGSEWNVFSV